MRRLLRSASRTAVAVGAALGLVACLLLLLGASPLEAGRVVWSNVFGSAEGVAYALFYATPLIFTGLAVAVGLRGGLFNIGAEGQLYMAAFATALAGLAVRGWSARLGLPVCLAAGVLAGSCWAAVPGVLKGWRGAHEVITTIMLNFIALGLTTYWATHSFREPGRAIPRTAEIADAVQLSRVADWVRGAAGLFEAIGAQRTARWLTDGPLALGDHVPLNGMFLLAVLACAVLAWAFRYTVWGFELEVVGQNPRAAAAVGIRVRRTLVLAMVVSGALAAGAGLNEVLGHEHRFTYAFSNGLGFLGIAVALLGRTRPFGVLLAALFFGVLVRGGLFLDLFTERVDKDVVFVVQGLLIWTVGLRGGLGRAGARWGGGAGNA